MDDLGPPVAYLALEEGVPVLAPGGERVGEVEHVLAAREQDIFEGLLVRTGDGHRFADIDQIEALHERGVVLAVEGGALHEPTESPAVLGALPADTAESELTAKLRRAWDFLSGRY